MSEIDQCAWSSFCNHSRFNKFFFEKGTLRQGRSNSKKRNENLQLLRLYYG